MEQKRKRYWALLLLLLAAGIGFVSFHKEFRQLFESLTSKGLHQSEDRAVASNGTEPDSLDSGSASSAGNRSQAARSFELEPGTPGGGSIFGRVSRDGLAYPGALVVLRATGSRMFEDPFYAEVTSGPDGTFRFEALPSGSFQIFAQDEGLLSFVDRDQMPSLKISRTAHRVGPVELELQEARQLQIKVLEAASGAPVSGAEVSVAELGVSQTTDAAGLCQFALSHELWTLKVEAKGFAQVQAVLSMAGEGDRSYTFRLNQGGRLFGTVRQRGGDVLEGALVSIQGAAIDLNGRSDASGYYEIEGIPLDERQFLFAEVKGFPRYFDGDFTMGQATTLERDLFFESPDKQPASLKGVVRNEAGVAVAGASLTIEAQQAETVSDSSGAYVFEGLTSNHFPALVLVEASGYAPSSDYIKIEGAMVYDPVLAPGVRVRGRVVDQFGVGIEAVRVLPFTADRITVRAKSVFSDEQGNFELEDMSPVGFLECVKSGYGSQRIALAEAGREGLLVVLRKGLDLLGKVVDSGSRAAIERFEVKVDQSGEDAYATMGKISFANQEGRFVLNSFADDHPVGVTIFADGYEPGFFDVAPSETSEEYLFPLVAGGIKIAGHITDSAGHPLDACTLRLRVLKGRGEERQPLIKAESAQTDRNGYFELKHVPSEATYHLNVSKTGYASTDFDHLEAQPDLANLSLSLNGEASIEGEVNLAVYPTAGAVRLNCANESTTLDRDGKFRIDQLSPIETCDVVLFDGFGYDELQGKTIALKPGEVSEVRFGFDGVYKVAGRITFGGQVLTQGLLYLIPKPNGKTATTTLNGEGYFSFEKVVAGDYGLVYVHHSSSNRLNDAQLLYSPDAVSLNVQADIYQEWDFPNRAKLTGRLLTPTPGWVARLRSPILAQDQPVAEDGSFFFESVAAGSYSLEAFRGDRVAQVVLAPIEMVEGVDLDLGDLEIRDGGRIRLVELSQPPTSEVTLNVLLRPQGGTSSRWEHVVTLASGESMLTDMPEGPASLYLHCYDPNRLPVPNQFEVVLGPDLVPELGFVLKSVTCLQFSTATPILSATLIPAQGGTSVAFLPYEGDMFKHQEAGAFFQNNLGAAVDLPEGQWRLKIVLTDGTKLEAQAQLRIGVYVGLRLDETPKP